MARLPEVTRDQLKPDGQKCYDEIAGSRGSVSGPYGILLHSPDLAARVAHTGAYVRFDFDMPNSLKEVVIITTAREIRFQYEFAAHARLAREAGVSEETIRTIASLLRIVHARRPGTTRHENDSALSLLVLPGKDEE